MRRTIANRGRSRHAAAALLAIAALVVAGCGGDDEGDAAPLDSVTSSLEENGYTVADTGAGSEFTKVEPTGSRLVQGNDIPAAGFVVVEAYPTAEDATKAQGDYESIKTPVVADDTLLYSAAKPADEADLDAVVDAAGS